MQYNKRECVAIRKVSADEFYASLRVAIIAVSLPGDLTI